MTANPIELGFSDDERRLEAFGLSTALIHSALRPGLSRAMNRTAMAMNSTAGTDIYHDSMEQLHLHLAEAGWRLVYVDRQPRLLHPEGLLAFTMAKGENVANPDRRIRPRTLPKGKATRESLTPQGSRIATLFGAESETEELEQAAERAPLWLLVHERTNRGLKVELSRPAQMTQGGVVDDWAERIILGFLDLDGDLSVFENRGDGGIDVDVQPL